MHLVLLQPFVADRFALFVSVNIFIPAFRGTSFQHEHTWPGLSYTVEGINKSLGIAIRCTELVSSV
jgi:hypothetical protein